MIASGIDGLDEIIGGGLATGDNVVWSAPHNQDLEPVWRALLDADRSPAHYVNLGSRQDLRSLPAWVEHIDRPLRSHSAVTNLGGLDDELVSLGVEGSRLVIDGLDDVLLAHGARATIDLYRKVCPRLFDRGVVAYWTASREILSPTVLDAITRIAQCVFELRDRRLRIVKAEGRPSRVQGALLELASQPDGRMAIERENSVGRLGEALRRLRRERNLSQAELAEIAQVTPGAISQVETGRRGLSVDTLVTLCESLGITLDALLGAESSVDHVLIRHDRGLDRTTSALGRLVSLVEDSAHGFRCYLSELEVGGNGGPPFVHKGTEVILVANGLVMLDLGDQTPVMRGGDALIVKRVPILSWSNLGPDPARLFWLALG